MTNLHIIATDGESKSISMYDCAKWDGCSAPICPLSGPYGTHFPEEEVCPWLVEAAKGTKGIPPKAEHSAAIMAAAREMWARKSELPFALRKVLNRASKSGSKRGSPTLLHKVA